MQMPAAVRYFRSIEGWRYLKQSFPSSLFKEKEDFFKVWSWSKDVENVHVPQSTSIMTATSPFPGTPKPTSDSLALLLPPSPAPSSGESTTSEPLDTEPEPLRIARQFVEAVNDRNWNHPCNAFFAPSYRARHDNWQADLSWEEQHKVYIAATTRFPKFHMEILGESVDVDEIMGKATVFHFIRVTGAPEGVQRDGLGLSKWRREGGKWMCLHHSGFRSGVEVW